MNNKKNQNRLFLVDTLLKYINDQRISSMQINNAHMILFFSLVLIKETENAVDCCVLFSFYFFKFSVFFFYGCYTHAS